MDGLAGLLCRWNSTGWCIDGVLQSTVVTLQAPQYETFENKIGLEMDITQN